jgi:hypothetical protein
MHLRRLGGVVEYPNNGCGKLMGGRYDFGAIARAAAAQTRSGIRNAAGNCKRASGARGGKIRVGDADQGIVA